MRVIDLSGQRVGMLIVLRRDGIDKRGRSAWRTQCDCGREKTISVRYLREGSVASCGCLRLKRSNAAKRLARNPKPKNPYDIDRPPVDVIPGSWLDDDGVVLPEYRDRVAAMRRVERFPAGEATQIAEARR